MKYPDGKPISTLKGRPNTTSGGGTMVMMVTDQGNAKLREENQELKKQLQQVYCNLSCSHIYKRDISLTLKRLVTFCCHPQISEGCVFHD